MSLKQDLALLIAQVHLHLPTLRKGRSPFLYILNRYNIPGLSRLHPIISLCIIHSLFLYILNRYNLPGLSRLHPIISLCTIRSLPLLSKGRSINIIIIIQSLFIDTEHINIALQV
jgi:hypothetical protein